MGGQWFNFNYGNDEVKKKNFVEITPEEQAAIDKAKKEAEDARLAQGLSNKQPDLGKGVTIQKSEPVRVDTGNGITRIQNPDGSVEFEIDYAKGYDGSPQMFAKGTKVTYLNSPQEPEKGFWAKIGDVIDRVNEWGNRVTGGQIRRLGSGTATLGTVAAGAAALEAAPAILSSSVSGLASSGVAGKAAVGAMALGAVGCSEGGLDEVPDPGQPDVNVQVTNKQMAQYVVDYLNNPNNEQKFKAETDDNVGFKYGYDYNQTNDSTRPYIQLGDNIKLYINQSPLTVPTTKNVIDYIDMLPGELQTDDGVGYKFEENQSGKAQVAFDNGITHTVGEAVDIKNDKPMGALYSLLGIAGFEQPALNEVLLGFKPNEQGSFGNGKEGFSLSLATPADLKDITTGNPQVKGSIGGVEFSGQLGKDQNGNVTITNGDKVVTISAINKNNPINIGNDVTPDVHDEGVIVSIGDDKFIMYPATLPGYDENNNFVETPVTMIGKIHDSQGEYGPETNIQNYVNNSNLFDTKGATQADEYYNDKQENLKQAQITADSNYRYMNQWKFDANAEANASD